MKRTSQRFRINKRLAEQSWGRLTNCLINSLKSLTSDYGVSVGRGDLICLDGHWYITHSGLLRLAFRRRCVGIQVEMVRDFCDPASARWAFRATVFPSEKSTGFVGFGDADPSNISSLVQGAELRVAETRAVNRALRKAYGIGICSVERSVLLPSHSRLENRRSFRPSLQMGMAMAVPKSGTASARSFASTSWMPL
jgi:hypothetical protein